MSTTGERIAQLRKERKMTQAKLAKEAGVSTSAIAMYETNRRQPDEATVQLLAKTLGVDPASFGAEAVIVTPASETEPQRLIKAVKPSEAVQNTSGNPSNGARDAKEAGWTNLTLSREEARFILFLRMHPDSMKFLQNYMSADASKRKQVEKAWRLIQAFQV